MPLILSGNVATATAATTYDVANSVRFNGADSPALKRNSMGTATNRKKWTLSMWVKRSTTDQRMLASFDGAKSYFQFQSGGQLEINDVPGSSFNYRLVTNAIYRDITSWMHIVVAYDSTQGTDTNRIKLYVNGEQPSLGTATYPDQNFEPEVNSTGSHKYGSYDDSTDYAFNGYFCEIVFIDGTQYAASDFGEFDSDSPRIWKPKDPSGLTFGTNGHYLDFEASGNLGNDVNGGTDFDENNIVAADQATDTCTNNFATMNSLVKGNTASTFSEGNLKVAAGGGWGHAVGNIGVAHGKWYWEVDEINANNNAFFGICNELNLGHLDGDSTPYSEAGLMLYFYDGRRTIDGTSSEGEYNAWGTTHGFALDLDSDPRTIKFYKDGSLEATENLTANFPAGEFVFPIFMGSASSNTASVEFNFGNPVTALASGNADANGYGSFEFSPPSGYIAICTKNLGSDGG